MGRFEIGELVTVTVELLFAGIGFNCMYEERKMIDYRKYITVEPDKRFGKPCIRGLRISVYDVFEWLSSGMTEAEILRDFPELTHEDILACYAYAADKERRTIGVAA